MQPYLIQGGIHTDQRGKHRFVNEFDLKGVCRFYTIQHPDISVIRAWQGHEIEAKWFFPLRGSFVLAWVKIDNFDKPSANLTADYKILKSDKPMIVHIPPGYANGLKALEAGSEIAVFSDMDVKESMKEKRRYPAECWFDWSRF
jgi:dTDP-4-dehydrorhamnose 3,5-epimerase-like enzyme